MDKNWFLKLRDIKEVIRREKLTCSNSKDGSTRDGYNKWCQKKDSNGNTALLVSGRKLLEQKQFEKAFELVKILLEEGADVNVINNENRTLLSYSILHMDNSIRLTKLLINHGANVWPICKHHFY